MYYFELLQKGTTDLDRKSRLSFRSTDMVSPDTTAPVGTISGLTDDRDATPDSGGFLTPGKKKASVSPSASGKQHSAIQRLEREKVAKEIRAKQVLV